MEVGDRVYRFIRDRSNPVLTDAEPLTVIFYGTDRSWVRNDNGREFELASNLLHEAGPIS